MGKKPAQVGKGDIPEVRTSGKQVRTDVPYHSWFEASFHFTLQAVLKFSCEFKNRPKTGWNLKKTTCILLLVGPGYLSLGLSQTKFHSLFNFKDYIFIIFCIDNSISYMANSPKCPTLKMLIPLFFIGMGPTLSKSSLLTHIIPTNEYSQVQIRHSSFPHH